MMIKLLDIMSRSWKGKAMVTEDEMKEKLKKLRETQTLQEQKTKTANEALTKARKRCSKEQAKLDDINAEINRIDGYLFKKVTLKYGFRDYEALEEYLKKNHSKGAFSEETKDKIIVDDKGDNK